MSAYVISNVDVEDEAQLRDYVRLVPPLVEKYGGRYVVRRGSVETLEGAWRPKAIVIVEFPTKERAKEWYESAEYEEMRARYFKGATRSMILVEGV
jgi:uncharacterized protein (DUF1330 family)